jgi:alkanesulfonate monooxygenase SsuD/methylene tetrahydromethanopterin reductase-like flavin-dependent oxidoreductase (luciferase family)
MLSATELEETLRMTHLVLRFDLRNLPGGPTSTSDLYAACLEQCAWGDRVGIDFTVLSEHHAAEDGFLPAPLTLAGAIVGRTQRLPVVIAALIAPINDPVRVAEQLVVLDLLAPGRVSVVLGAGYRPEEFEMYGAKRSARGSSVDEFARALLSAFTGEPFTWRGRTVQVTPVARTEPHPAVLIGGSAPASARRAARLGLGFFPSIGDPELAEVYRRECKELGFTGGFVMLPSGPGFVHVSEDPERDWERLAPYVLHDAKTYDSWQTPDVRSAVHVRSQALEEIKTSGVYRVVTPDECVALADSLGPGGTLSLHPLMGGMPPEMGWESLELFAAEVLPRIKDV